MINGDVNIYIFQHAYLADYSGRRYGPTALLKGDRGGNNGGGAKKKMSMILFCVCNSFFFSPIMAGFEKDGE